MLELFVFVTELEATSDFILIQSQPQRPRANKRVELVANKNNLDFSSP